MAANYALILFILTTVSGLVVLGWLILTRLGYKLPGDSDRANPIMPVALCQSLFPVFLAVFLIRSFVVEPFRIPSESMLPTLRIGDFILVNKFTYGLRLPLSHAKLSSGNALQHGDIIVFRYPKNQKLPYIKRVIGLPGDEIMIDNKQLYINNEPVPLHLYGQAEEAVRGRQILLEDLRDRQYQVMHDQQRQAYYFSAVVPDGHYFVLGDNRDYSKDSRYWGFVPESHIIGEAFFIWFHWHKGIGWDRIGTRII